MTDLEAARQAVRDVVEPLRLRCDGYRVEEQLGYARGEEWVDDGYLVFVRTDVTPGEGFPWAEHEDNRWSFKVAGTCREDAIRGLQSEVEGHISAWRRMLERDKELEGLVGGRIRALKAGSYYREGIMKAEYEAHGDVQKAQQAAKLYVDPGDEFDVVAHEPGKVRVSAGFWISTWRFDNARIGLGDVRTPDPYFEVL